MQYTWMNTHSYKIIMYMHKLYHFCNIHTPDDGLGLGSKYLGNNQIWKVYQPIPTKYHKINTATQKD